MKRLVLIIGIVAALLLSAAPANASGYPPKPPTEAPPAEIVQPPAEAPAPSGALPPTGDGTSLPLARAAVVMVAAGGLLVLAVRRRRAILA
ncbi:MAG TPA: hypothetical protein VFZ68_17325 [Acidimicrobiales bacterium]